MAGRIAGLLVGAAIAASAAAQSVPIVQPGAPGQPAADADARAGGRIADTRFIAADVDFMQAMIHHHHQAVEMAALVAGADQQPAIADVARRIAASQADEIRFMRDWLRAARPDGARSGGGARRLHHAGTATACRRWRAWPRPAADGRARAPPAAATFDRLFLQRMIAHHDGALTMVEDLLRRPGSAYDPVLFEFVNEVINEQQAEIKRMGALLRGLSERPARRPRAGYRDAGQAISNMRLVAALPKPAGFFDPANPAGLPAAQGREGGDAERRRAAPTASPATAPSASERSPLLSFANTDMAFAGDLLAVGNYHGFNLYRLDAAGAPRLVSSVVCPGGQGDVSIVGNLLIMSVEQTRGRRRLRPAGRRPGRQPRALPRHAHLRHLQPRAPASRSARCRPAAARTPIRSCRAPSATARIIVYVSGTSSVRAGRGAGGLRRRGRRRRPHRPVPHRRGRDPASPIPPARASSTARRCSPTRDGRLAGLWQGGGHGEGTQETSRTDQCHDITVFPSRKLAAGACSGNGIIFDISDPRRPRRIDAVSDPISLTGTRRPSTMTAPRCCSPTNGAAAGGRAAARRTRATGAPTRSTTSSTAGCGSAATQAAGGADRAGELRRPQRLDRPRPRPRYLRPGLVPGRHLGDRFHRLRPPGRDRLFRPRPGRSPSI